MSDNDSNMQHITIHKPKKPWYKRVWLWIGVIVLLLIIVGAAGSKSNLNTTPSNSSNANSSTSSSSNTPASTKPATTAKIGDTLSLKDQNDNGLDVTLVKIVDPGTSDNEFTTPDSGKRFVGVQLKLTNTSTNLLSESPDNDLTVFDSTGQSYSASLYSLSNCPDFATGAKQSPNSPELGCVSFQIPIGIKIAKVQFTPSGSFANSTGEWVTQ